MPKSSRTGTYETTGGTAQGATSGAWPNGEPKSVRDAADAKQK